MSAPRKSSSLGMTQPRSAGLGLVGREILAPGDHIHTEREPDSHNLRANVAGKAENAERLTHGDRRPP